ncbi:MAG: LytTR family DNA-binding domain-containing protein [Roseburia sp.]|nr:LytTR family DNA-binding domain-containing protein [Roseburia sp.]
MQIAVCDDEKNMARSLCAMIGELDRESRVSCYTDGPSLLRGGGFDLVFLDIGMEPMDGMELAGRIREKNKKTLIVFVTALKEYVYDCFEVGAFWYLLKPVSKDKLEQVLCRAKEEWRQGQDVSKKQIFIQTKGQNYLLFVDDILYLENQKRKVLIHTREEQIAFYAAMSKLEKSLGEGFYRCHRGYLVNFAYVAGYDAKSIRLLNHETIYLAKNKYPDFVVQYMRYLRNGGVTFV